MSRSHLQKDMRKEYAICIAVRNAVQAQTLMWSYSGLLKSDVDAKLIEWCRPGHT